MASDLSLLMLIMVMPRTLAAPFSSIRLDSGANNDGIPLSTSMVDVPPGYSPTTPPLELTVNPSQPGPTVTISQPAYTVTVTSAPKTVQTAVTATSVFEHPSSTSEYLPITSNGLPSSEAPARPAEWTLPLHFTSMDDAFHIEHYAFGRENVHLSTTNGGEMEPAMNGSSPSTDTTILEILYPRGSYSPSHEPRGGTDFYAVPSFSLLGGSGTDSIPFPGSTDTTRPLENASNVTLSYSVFFPSTFDFVKGGKLPGLYGGHER